jgi:ferredoxin-NADP reductase
VSGPHRRVNTGRAGTFDVLIARCTEEARGVVSLELRHPAGADLPAWLPGAHIDLLLNPDVVRQYSLCSRPSDRDVWQIAVLRESDGRGGSRLVHDELGVGDTITVRGPRNHFALEPAKRYIFIAGGIGITPIMAMADAAAGAGADYGLTYGGRSLETMAFRDDLVSAHGDRVAIWPEDHMGLLDLPSLLAEPDDSTLIYCCGPEPLLRAVEEHTAAWPSGALRVERFAPKELDEPALASTFEVELAQSGKTVTVPPDRSLLHALESVGIYVLSTCQEGTCGTCEVPVLEGTVDHRDSVLTAEEQAAMDTMLACVSRAACPRLVLDL